MDGVLYESREDWKINLKIKKRKKITQEQLGQKLGVNSKAVSKWECGIILDFSITNYYDAIDSATAIWSGTW